MTDVADNLERAITESIEVKRRTLRQCLPDIEKITAAILGALKSGNKILLCGNGGSAADAQHVAGELVGRFKAERRSLPAIALTADSSITSCIGNDYGFEDIFARPVEGLAQPGDVVVGISTSGNSPNVIRAMQAAKAKQAVSIGFTGEAGGKLKESADLCLCIPSRITAHIQESHITVWHVICEAIDAAFI